MTEANSTRTVVRQRGSHAAGSEWAASVWRILRSRRLAVALLIGLGLISILGAIVPQEPRMGPTAYEEWAGQNPRLSVLLSWLSLNSLYSAWWFLALFCLLYINTLTCTLPQLRAAYRRSTRWPRTIMPGKRRAAYELPLAASADQSLALAAAALHERKYRVSCLHASLVGRKGLLAQWGSPVFHLGLIVILTGVAIGGLMGFAGYVEVGEGQGFLESRGAYLQHSQGPLFGHGGFLDQMPLAFPSHRNFVVRLDTFTFATSSWGKGIPSDVVSDVTVLEGEQELRRDTIRINQPLEYQGMTIYPTSSSGLAPVFDLELPDGQRDSGMVNLASRGEGRYENTLTVPGTSYRMIVRAQNGDQGVEIDVLDRGRSVYEGRLEPGQATKIGNIVLTLTSLRHWTGLRVVFEPGTMVLYAGFGLALLGLVLSFVLVYREVWFEVVERPEGRVLRLGGRAPRLKAHLYQELEQIRDLLWLRLDSVAAEDRASVAKGQVEAWIV